MPELHSRIGSRTLPDLSATSDLDTMSGLHGRRYPVVVVGGGQAGLSMSYLLTCRGIEHVVLERHRLGFEWRERRWDTFCLVTPNWQCQLPGFPYSGDDPDGFMSREQVVRYLEGYAASFAPPLVQGVAATRLRGDGRDGFSVETSAGTLTARQVVLATGPYQVPLIPRMAERLPEDLVQLHSADYRSPGSLPAGAVLVVGTGQSGCQIAEDLHLAGRQVHLATGSAPRVARRYRGRDVVAWLAEMGYYRRGIETFADADAVRFRANHYVTGRDGGHDIDLRAFALDGMRLYGRLTGADVGVGARAGVSAGVVEFADDLRRNLDGADAVSESIKASIDQHIAAAGIDAPVELAYRPPWQPNGTPTRLDLAGAGITSVVWCTGFGRDHRWVELPIFDGRGYPCHERGVTSYPGLYVLGMPWQHTWGSGRFSGVGDDAAFLVDRIMAYQPSSLERHEVIWLAGTRTSTYPRDDEWVAPRTVA